MSFNSVMYEWTCNWCGQRGTVAGDVNQGPSLPGGWLMAPQIKPVPGIDGGGVPDFCSTDCQAQYELAADLVLSQATMEFDKLRDSARSLASD